MHESPGWSGRFKLDAVVAWVCFCIVFCIPCAIFRLNLGNWRQQEIFGVPAEWCNSHCMMGRPAIHQLPDFYIPRFIQQSVPIYFESSRYLVVNPLQFLVVNINFNHKLNYFIVSDNRVDVQ